MSPCPSSHEVECVFPRAVHTHTHSMLIHRPMQKEFTGFMWTQTADCLILLLILAVFILTPCTALSPALPCVWFIPYTYHKKSCTILRLFFLSLHPLVVRHSKSLLLLPHPVSRGLNWGRRRYKTTFTPLLVYWLVGKLLLELAGDWLSSSFLVYIYIYTWQQTHCLGRF